MALRLFTRKRTAESEGLPSQSVSDASVCSAAATAGTLSRPASPLQTPYEPAEPTQFDEDSLRRQVQLERYGIIQAHATHWRDHPEIQSVYQAACEALDEQFAIVPEGFASLPLRIDDSPGCPEADYEVDSFLLSRYAVTNEQYQKFVDVGAYEELDLWPQEIWPHIIDFKDLTGTPGPRFWRNGRHNRRLGDHPVVGVCCYEAIAYACWAGYRLPSESEWQMAASWRIRSSANVLRRYPWGDAFDVRRCNIWASGLGQTVPVNGYEAGIAPNGIHQLVGNVWEWTASDFDMGGENGEPVVGDMLLKSIRGGAFDTYFPSQATSCFRTGLASLARAHNVGFRCAMDLPQSTGTQS
jgi:iron(II)-dependent oxidoreductase